MAFLSCGSCMTAWMNIGICSPRIQTGDRRRKSADACKDDPRQDKSTNQGVKKGRAQLHPLRVALIEAELSGAPKLFDAVAFKRPIRSMP